MPIGVIHFSHEGISSTCAAAIKRDLLDQLLDEALRDIEVTLVFGQVAFFVGLIQQQLLLRLESLRVFEALEYQIAVFAAIAVHTQDCQRGRMRGVVDKVKAAFQ